MGLTHLSIVISGSSIAFTILKDGNLTFESSLTIADKPKEELESYLSSNPLLNHNFDEEFLSFSSNRSTLVPNNIFAESTATAIHKLCFGQVNENTDVDYNRIPEVGVVNVFEISSWIKRFFILKFPRIIIQHEGSFIVRKMLTKNAFNLKATISLHSGYFQLSIIKHSKLEFYSFFEYQNDEDILYHLLFVLQQKEMTGEKGTLELINSSDKNTVFIDALEKNIKRVKELNKIKVERTESYISKAQLLCV